MWLVLNLFDWYSINSDTNLIIFITFYVFVFWYRLWGKFQIIFSFTIRCLIYCHFMIINLFANCNFTRQVWWLNDYQILSSGFEPLVFASTPWAELLLNFSLILDRHPLYYSHASNFGRVGSCLKHALPDTCDALPN